MPAHAREYPVELRCAPVVLHGGSVRLRGQLIPEVSSAEIEVVRFHAPRLALFQRGEAVRRRRRRICSAIAVLSCCWNSRMLLGSLSNDADHNWT